MDHLKSKIAYCLTGFTAVAALYLALSLVGDPTDASAGIGGPLAPSFNKSNSLIAPLGTPADSAPVLLVTDDVLEKQISPPTPKLAEPSAVGESGDAGASEDSGSPELKKGDWEGKTAWFASRNASSRGAGGSGGRRGGGGGAGGQGGAGFGQEGDEEKFPPILIFPGGGGDGLPSPVSAVFPIPDSDGDFFPPGDGSDNNGGFSPPSFVGDGNDTGKPSFVDVTEQPDVPGLVSVDIPDGPGGGNPGHDPTPHQTGVVNVPDTTGTAATLALSLLALAAVRRCFRAQLR